VNERLGKTTLNKYEIHVRVHSCYGKSCETRLRLWNLYMIIAKQEHAPRPRIVTREKA
jgi:hypothetical protein